MTCLDDSGWDDNNPSHVRLQLVWARNEIVLLKDALRSIEFSYKQQYCPHCHGYDGEREHPRLHIPECPVARVLKSDKLVQMVYDEKDEIREAYKKHDAGYRLRDK